MRAHARARARAHTHKTHTHTCTYTHNTHDATSGRNKGALLHTHGCFICTDASYVRILHMYGCFISTDAPTCLPWQFHSSYVWMLIESSRHVLHTLIYPQLLIHICTHKIILYYIYIYIHTYIYILYIQSERLKRETHTHTHTWNGWWTHAIGVRPQSRGPPFFWCSIVGSCMCLYVRIRQHASAYVSIRKTTVKGATLLLAAHIYPYIYDSTID